MRYIMKEGREGLGLAGGIAPKIESIVHFCLKAPNLVRMESFVF